MSLTGIRAYKRNLQALAILVLAVTQIVSARLTDSLHIGQGVELRSAATSHPLVPWGYAFSIWGAIYLYSLVAALWQMLPKQRYSSPLKTVGWNIAGIYLINTIWQIWVPLRGIDAASCVMLVVSLFLGIHALLSLRNGPELSAMDGVFVFGPLALVTGWLTAACFVNISSALVGAHAQLNPSAVNVSLGFLIVLIAVGGVIVRLSHSVLYSLALMWALFWIMMANMYRYHEPVMATVSVIGIALLVAICGWTLVKDGHTRALPA